MEWVLNEKKSVTILSSIKSSVILRKKKKKGAM